MNKIIYIVGALLGVLLLWLLWIWIKSLFNLGKKSKPECEKWWTIIYYGARGSGK